MRLIQRVEQMMQSHCGQSSSSSLTVPTLFNTTFSVSKKLQVAAKSLYDVKRNKRVTELCAYCSFISALTNGSIKVNEYTQENVSAKSEDDYCSCRWPPGFPCNSIMCRVIGGNCNLNTITYARIFFSKLQLLLLTTSCHHWPTNLGQLLLLLSHWLSIKALLLSSAH